MEVTIDQIIKYTQIEVDGQDKYTLYSMIGGPLDHVTDL